MTNFAVAYIPSPQLGEPYYWTGKSWRPNWYLAYKFETVRAALEFINTLPQGCQEDKYIERISHD